MTFGRKLRGLRVAKSLTQQEMADLLGISRATYGAYERDKSKPMGIEKYRKLADILGCKLSYLADVEEEKDNSSYKTSWFWFTGQEHTKRPYETGVTPEQLRDWYTNVTANGILAFVNAYGTDNEGFAKIIAASHRTLQQSVMRLFIKIIEEISKQPTDLRNEQAVELAKRITEVAKDYALPLI